MQRTSVCIVGGGIVGAFLFDELSLLGEKPILVEKGEDVSLGATKANSGILHAGYDCQPNTLKAKYNVLGLKMYKSVAKRLGEKLINCGSLVVGDGDSLARLQELKDRGDRNGVKNMSILDRKNLLTLEPNLADNIQWGLYAKDACIISSYHFCVSLVEEGALNGGKIKLNFNPQRIVKISTEIIDKLPKNTSFWQISKVIDDCEQKANNSNDNMQKKYCYIVLSDNDFVVCDSVINCAGAGVNEISKLLGEKTFPLQFVKGEYILLDNSEGSLVHRPIFPLPSKIYGKGILACPTVHGNVFFGPTAIPVDNCDTSVSSSSLAIIKNNALKLINNINFRKTIKLYAGIRVKTGHDFEMYFSQKNIGFVTLAGICSPGLTSAPALAHDVVKYLQKIEIVKNKEINVQKIVKRKPYSRIFELNHTQLDQLIKQNGDYGEIVCNCERITKGEILEVLKSSPISPLTTDGVKRRLRTTMGHCQGSFCYGKLAKIMAEYYGVDESEIIFRGNTSLVINDIKNGGIYQQNKK
ncbi:MAG: NAD(P)/FAD-dependent oxidoreductase [Christensenellales bacterium]